MSTYNTGNPVPSIDPRDLDDNATIFDRLLTEHVASILDRLGVARKTWWQLEQDALALSSPNVSALAGLTGAADRLPYFTGSGAMSLTVLTAQARQLLDDTSFTAMLVTLGAAARGVNADITSITGLTTALSVAQGGTGATTAANARTNLGLGTVATLDTIPLAQGGTGATTAANARTNLGLGTAAIATLGTSGNNLGLLNTANTWSAAQAILGVTPVTDGGSNCGTSGLRWATVFAQTGTINTSDAREKTPVRTLSPAELEASSKLGSEIGVYKWLAAIDTKGQDARQHIGMTVQRAIEIMADAGLEPMTYGFICYDEWEGGDRYAFRMDELNAFIAAGFSQRLAILEEKLTP